MVGEAVGVLVGVTLGVGVAVGVMVGEAVGVLVGVAVGVDVAVGVTVGEAVGVLVGVTVGVLVGVEVGVLVGVALGVSVGEAVGVSVGVTVGVWVGVAVGHGFPEKHSESTPEGGNICGFPHANSKREGAQAAAFIPLTVIEQKVWQVARSGVEGLETGFSQQHRQAASLAVGSEAATKQQMANAPIVPPHARQPLLGPLVVPSLIMAQP